MNDKQSTDRFSGLADIYDKHRPTYPASAIDFICEHLPSPAESLVVDVGCGTGISSRLFAQRGYKVVGIEPNNDMRNTAQAIAQDLADDRVSYQCGSSEQTGLPDASADLVVSAQAFHWFDPEPTLREFHRILRPGGWVALIWNQRDESDPLTHRYGSIMRTAPEVGAAEWARSEAGKPLLTCPLFEESCERDFPNEQVLSEADLIGRAFSSSYAPKADPLATSWREALHAAFAEFQSDNRVTLRYRTKMYLARRLEVAMS